MARPPKFQTPTGVHDVLPADWSAFGRILRAAEDIARFYGFQRLDPPVIEFAELFEKGTGASSDIVEKEMYTIKTKGGDMLALRPEFTPGMARAFLQHGMSSLPQPVKLYTWGPLFRYEHPQAGRYRQFHQVDFEVFGEDAPVVDAQLIQIAYGLLRDLKLSHLIVEVNSIGDSACRPHYRKSLVSYLRARQSSLCANCKKRLKTNPLRILDCKEEKCQRVRAQAPQMVDHLCDPCKNHLKALLEFLDAADIPYHLDPYLVRGLDYYTRTVFEIQTERSSGLAGLTLAAGGRYDNLVKLYGNKDVPAVGFAAGVERIAEEMEAKGIAEPSTPAPKVFLAQLGDLAKKKSLKIIEEFRRANITVADSLGRDSLRAQLSRADKLGVEVALLFGQREVLDNTIVLRRMDTGEQETISLDVLVEEVKKRLRGGKKP